MKVDRFHCDRCRVTYNYNKSRAIECRKSQRYAGFGILNTTGNIIRYDLCDACMDELIVFINHPEITLEAPDQE